MVLVLFVSGGSLYIRIHIVKYIPEPHIDTPDACCVYAAV